MHKNNDMQPIFIAYRELQQYTRELYTCTCIVLSDYITIYYNTAIYNAADEDLLLYIYKITN